MNKIFYVYEHFDPITNEIVYVGKGTRGRAWNLQKNSPSRDCVGGHGRNKEHFHWANNLLENGITPDEFVRIYQKGLTSKEAHKIENDRMWKIRPRFNKIGGGSNRREISDDEIKRLRQEGLSYSQLAERFSISNMTAWRHVNDKNKGNLHETE